jgi:hypothetical protein
MSGGARHDGRIGCVAAAQRFDLVSQGPREFLRAIGDRRSIVTRHRAQFVLGDDAAQAALHRIALRQRNVRAECNREA